MKLLFKIERIPDLTLYKYASLAESGVKGVLNNHLPLLRQMNRRGIMADVTFHLFYIYTPEAPVRKRLSIYLMAKYQDSREADIIRSIIYSSQLADFYDFIECGEEELKSVPKYKICNVLSKNEEIIGGTFGRDYYYIPEIEVDQDARLYNMCKIMEKLDQSVVYRVDLKPVEVSGEIREKLTIAVNNLKNNQGNTEGRQRDYVGQEVAKRYEKIIKEYAEAPHFVANVVTFSNSDNTAELVLEAAASEAVSKGKYRITRIEAVNQAFDISEPISLHNYNSMLYASNKNLSASYYDNRESEIVISVSNMSFKYVSVLFTLDEIAPFFRMPALYDGEVIQIPKETVVGVETDKKSILLGIDKDGYEVNFPLEFFPKHAFISGVPGSGKTNTMHHITSSLWKEGIPFLVFEPAKQEYRALFHDPNMKGLYFFSPNADMSFPLHINPFEMAKGVSVSEHIGRLYSVFEGAFSLEPPLPFLLDSSIEAVYRRLGWEPEHIYTGEEKKEDGTPRELPTMSLLYEQLEIEMDKKYKGDVHDNIESALQVRIGSLLKREMGAVFDVPKSSIEPEKWLTIPAIIELESMGRGPANFLTLMLLSLIRETLKVNPSYNGESGVRHVIFIEEAHNLIGPESEEKTGLEADPKQAATAFVVKMLAEVRALHEGIVIADQLPTVMADEVLKNTGLKIGLRITSQDDRSLLGGTMAASNMRLEEMATFDVGKALTFYERLKRPLVMRIIEWLSSVKPEDKEPLNDKQLKDYLKTNKEYSYTLEQSVSILLKKHMAKYDIIYNSFVKSKKIVNENISFFKKLQDVYKQRQIVDPMDEGFVKLDKEYTQLIAWYKSNGMDTLNQKAQSLFASLKKLFNSINLMREKRKAYISKAFTKEIDKSMVSIVSLLNDFSKLLLQINYQEKELAKIKKQAQYAEELAKIVYSNIKEES